MDVKTAMEQFLKLQSKLAAYQHASNMIYLDGVTGAPSDGSEQRGITLGILSEEEYNLQTCKQSVELVEFLMAHRDALDFTQRRMVENYHRASEFTASIPVDEYVAYTMLLNDAEQVWHKAKKQNDYSLFQPYLRKIVDANRRFAGYYKPDWKPYDVLLDQYEYGLNMETADAFFDALKAKIVPLLQRVQAAPQIDDSFLFGDFPKAKQQELAAFAMNLMGLHDTSCILRESEHPFTLNFNSKDVRITTHYYPDNVASSLFSVVHEGGHALYELGVCGEYDRTSLAGGVSMGIHESQSRLYENIIGRSRAFVGLIYPELCRLFPDTFKNVTQEQLYRALNKAQPSLIRTEADELTYSLHVLVRYELEKELIAGTLDVDDLPQAWNEKYKTYLGVDVPNDTQGVLQDSHWSGGNIGYFPSYALGSAYGAQFMAKMREDFDVDACVANGQLSKVTEWLHEHLHQYGALYHPSELIEKCCGKPFDPTYYTDYLEKKFSEIYAL